MRWPWQPKKAVSYEPKRWPKKVHFLDGPMAGKTGMSHGGFFVPVLYMKAPSRTANFFDGNYELPSVPESVYDYWRYEWETVYPNGNVAYVRFAA